MTTVQEVVGMLKARAVAENIPGMRRFGMSEAGRLGVAVPEMRSLAKSLGKDHQLAQGLWDTAIAEARILASMIDEPGKLTAAQMEAWVMDFDSWDVCDQVCMNLFEKSPLAWKMIGAWSVREEEYVKRAAYALIACLAWHDKQANDKAFLQLFSVLKNGATDERNFVKKAVNWAIRNIGKRNPALNRAALDLSREIQQMDAKAARWIATDALRELESEAVQGRLKKT